VTCIVKNPPGGFCDVLLNPGNADLVGTELPYFPMPIKPPAGLHTSLWGGMEAGENMFYPTQCIDGQVWMACGSKLSSELSILHFRFQSV